MVVESKKNLSPYFYAVGRRKTAVATVRVFSNKALVQTVNGKELRDYFLNQTLISNVLKPFNDLGLNNQFSFTAKIVGGGKTGQADALRLAIARALILQDPESRLALKKNGLLSRDSREKESKKYGLKKARKAPQFSKR